jgi:hypothetical protein
MSVLANSGRIMQMVRVACREWHVPSFGNIDLASMSLSLMGYRDAYLLLKEDASGPLGITARLLIVNAREGIPFETKPDAILSLL